MCPPQQAHTSSRSTGIINQNSVRQLGDVEGTMQVLNINSVPGTVHDGLCAINNARLSETDYYIGQLALAYVLTQSIKILNELEG